MPKLKVHSNIGGEIYTKPYSIAKNLVKQIYTAVDWESTTKLMYDDWDLFNGDAGPTTYECGPGKQLGAMLKHTNAKAYERYKNIFEK